MHKVGSIVRFDPSLDEDDAAARWQGPHAALAGVVPGVERYVQNRPTANLGLVGVEPRRTAFDGYSCVWFADREHREAAAASPEWKAMAADGAEIFDLDATDTMQGVLEEALIIDGPLGPFKAVWVVRFKDEIRADPSRTKEAHQYWIGTHGGAFGVKVPGIDRYVQNHAVEPLADDGRMEFDGFSECWFQDRAAFDLCMASEEWGEMNTDAENLFDVGWIVGGMSALLDETVVKG
jgi:uncharacterized protein (TIGR02118 family)